VWVVRNISSQKGWLVMPREDRWHRKPVALYGGVGFVPVLLGVQIFFLLTPQTQSFYLQVSLLLGTVILFTLGWLDDVFSFGPLIKLIVQMVASSSFIFFGGVLSVTSFFYIDLIITSVWFLIIINALNMLDNMDGLAVGVAIISLFCLVLLSFDPTNKASLAVLLAVPFIGALIAFWFFNKAPATIFMGDAGSLSIGFILASLSIPSTLNNYFGVDFINNEKLLLFLFPVLLMAVPLMDLCFVSVTRILRGKKPYIGGRDHSSHVMVLLGNTEKQSVSALYLLTFMGGLIALTVKFYTFIGVVLFGVYFFLLLFFAIYKAAKSKSMLWNESR